MTSLDFSEEERRAIEEMLTRWQDERPEADEAWKARCSSSAAFLLGTSKKQTEGFEEAPPLRALSHLVMAASHAWKSLQRLRSIVRESAGRTSSSVDAELYQNLWHCKEE